MAAYYNECDPFAAAWLRELIKEKLIADGEVDERSIAEVSADDVRGFTQCHWFAGIGGWSYALRLAGWDDSRPVWSGSCPCQPFSSAGTQAGGHDPRDLWPTWFQLISQCRPVVVFGEQVEAAIGHGWLDRVCDDLESENYAVGACGLPAASVGAFHIRQRLWFVAESERDVRRSQPWRRPGAVQGRKESERPAQQFDRCRDDGSDVADTDERNAVNSGIQRGGQHGLRAEDRRVDGHARDDERPEIGELADSENRGQRIDGRASGQAGHIDERSPVAQLTTDDVVNAIRAGLERHGWDGDDGNESRRQRTDATGSTAATGAARELADARGERRQQNPGSASGDESTDGWRSEGNHLTASHGENFWSDCEWIPCADGKARPIEPGTFPLAHGVSARVGRLRGYGNAIVPACAQAFIEAYLDVAG